MVAEIVSYTDLPRKERLAIKRDIAKRVVDIVTEHHPEPVLMAELNAQITSETPIIDSAEGEPLDRRVSIGHAGVVVYSAQLAIERGDIVPDSWGDEITYRLPLDEQSN